MFRLLRDGCFFINHHHHFRIGLHTIHFHHPDLTQFCLCCELCLLRCFGFLGTVLPTLTPSIVHHSTHHFCKPFELLHQPTHSRYHNLTFDVSDFEFAVFPFPKVFRILRDESPSSWCLHKEHRHSSSPRMVTSISPWYCGIPSLYILPYHYIVNP